MCHQVQQLALLLFWLHILVRLCALRPVPHAGLLNWLPSFFKDAYHVEIAQLATFTLLPYVVQGGVGAGAGREGAHNEFGVG